MKNLEDVVTNILAYVKLGYKPKKMVKKILQEWLNQYTDDVAEVISMHGRDFFHTQVSFANGAANKEEALHAALFATVEAIKSHELLSTSIKTGKTAANRYTRATSKTINFNY